MKQSRLKRVLLTFLAGMALMHVLSFWNVRQWVLAGYPDFAGFYAAGKIVRQGLGSQLYDSGIQWRAQQEFAPNVHIRLGPLRYIHPPFEALLVVPFTYLSYGKAHLLWDAANLLIGIALPFLLQPHLPALREFPPLLQVLALLAFFPVFIALLQGQDSILILLFYSLAFLALKKDRQFSAGCWLGLGLCKLHLIVPFVVILLLRKKVKVLSGFLLTAAVLAAISLAVAGWQGIMSYPRFVWWLEQHPAQGAVLPGNMPNLRGFVEGFLSGFVPAPLILVAVGVFSVLLVWLAAAQWRSVSENDAPRTDLAFSLSLVATVLVSYHAFAYDFSPLLLPILLLANYLVSAGPPRGRSRAALVGPMLILFVSPLYVLLWLRFGHLNLLAGVLLLWMWGIAKEISRPSVAAS